jgi:hypothetical protein
VWLTRICIPGRSKEETWKNLQRSLGELSTNYKMKIPDLRVGRLFLSLFPSSGSHSVASPCIGTPDHVEVDASRGKIDQGSVLRVWVNLAGQGGGPVAAVKIAQAQPWPRGAASSVGGAAVVAASSLHRGPRVWMDPCMGDWEIPVSAV